jgi:hypothetical protein
VCTGACSTGGGDKYYINNTATPLDSEDNMFFFEHYKVPANGSVRGIGSNDGDVRTSGTTAAKSYVLYNHNTSEWPVDEVAMCGCACVGTGLSKAGRLQECSPIVTAAAEARMGREHGGSVTTSINVWVVLPMQIAAWECSGIGCADWQRPGVTPTADATPSSS